MRVALTCSELALKRGDTDKAIALLSNAAPEKPYFVQALITMANVSLMSIYFCLFRLVDPSFTLQDIFGS